MSSRPLRNPLVKPCKPGRARAIVFGPPHPGLSARCDKALEYRKRYTPDALEAALTAGWVSSLKR